MKNQDVFQGLIMCCMTFNCVRMSKGVSMKEWGEKIREHAKKVLNPQTEEDHVEALNHWVRHIMHVATEKYRGWAGFADLSGVDIDEIMQRLTHEDFTCVVHVVTNICQKFNVAHPSKKRSRRSFKKWYKETCKKMGLNEKYPDFILERIPT